MNVQKISVSLRKQTIKALNEAAAKEKRSRSQYIQLVLEAHLQQPQNTRSSSSEIAIKMG